MRRCCDIGVGVWGPRRRTELTSAVRPLRGHVRVALEGGSGHWARRGECLHPIVCAMVRLQFSAWGSWARVQGPLPCSPSWHLVAPEAAVACCPGPPPSRFLPAPPTRGARFHPEFSRWDGEFVLGVSPRTWGRLPCVGRLCLLLFS